MSTHPSESIQSQGGKARSEKLSPETRSAIASAAASARWANTEGASTLPKASHDGDLEIAGRKIKAAVLPNGQRLLTQGTFLMALGRSRTPKAGTGGLATVDGLPFFLQAEQLKPFISEELAMSTTPIFFRLKSGQKAVGYDARVLTGVCEVYLKLRDHYAENSKPVPKNYQHIVKTCDLLMRGFADVGIIALVDEATGYQEVRDRQALQEILKHYFDGKLYEWTRTFPTEFFKEIFRLKGWEWNAGKMPGVVGKYVNDLVYLRLADGLLGEIQKVNPRDEKGRLTHKNYRFLTPTGHPQLETRLQRITGMMEGFGDGEWDKFHRRVEQKFPRLNHTIPLPLND